jgi:hypothetical protein
MRFAFGDLDDYERWVLEVAGALTTAVRRLSEGARNALRAELAEGFTPFATESGYDIPGVALCAVAS